MRIPSSLLKRHLCGVCATPLNLKVAGDTMCPTCKRVWTKEEIEDGSEQMPIGLVMGLIGRISPT